MATIIHTYGTETVLPVEGTESGQISKENYQFQGWFKDQQLTDGPYVSIGATEITGDGSYYAKWKRNYEYVESVYGTDWTSMGLVHHTDAVSGDYWGNILRYLYDQSGTTWPGYEKSDATAIYSSINPYNTNYYFVNSKGVGGIHCIGIKMKTTKIVTKVNLSPYAGHTNNFSYQYARDNTITRVQEGENNNYVYLTYGSRPGSKNSGYYILSYGNTLMIRQTIVDGSDTYVIDKTVSTGKTFSDGFTSQSVILKRITTEFDFVPQLVELNLSENAKTTQIEFFTPYNNVEYIGILINGIQVYTNS